MLDKYLQSALHGKGNWSLCNIIASFISLLSRAYAGPKTILNDIVGVYKDG